MNTLQALALCFALLLPATAVAAPGPHGHQERKGGKVIRELNLTDEQKKAMKELRQEAKRRADEARSLPEADRKAAMERLRSDMDARQRTILTAEQKRKLDSLKADRRQR